MGNDTCLHKNRTKFWLFTKIYYFCQGKDIFYVYKLVMGSGPKPKLL